MNKSLLALGCFGLWSTAAMAADAAKGKDVFEANCSVCHNAATTETKLGPGLKGLFKKDELNNKKKVTDANVVSMINEGGNGMPPFADALTRAEREDLIAYLKSL
jgi:mono/diheme cytochrome c family protein